MVRILYGVCGEGLGHASRSRILIKYLQKKHDISIVAGGRAYDLLAREFKNIEKIESAHFRYKHGQVSLLHTILSTLYRILVRAPKSYKKIQTIIKEFKPDIILTDAEPFSHYAAHAHGLKRISIDNPHALIYRKYPVSPTEFLPWFVLIVAMKITMFNADQYIVYDFFDTPSEDSRVTFFKPLIQRGILQKKPRYGDHIFVYQTVLSAEFITRVLKTIDEQFVVYGFNIDKIEGNLTFRRFNETVFFEDIASAKAVVTTAGFTVISEALYLKKPLFVLPIKNQFEQIVNGKFVEQLGAGVAHIEFHQKDLVDFLNNLELYKQNLQSYNPDEQQKILQGIEHVINQVIAS